MKSGVTLFLLVIFRHYSECRTEWNTKITKFGNDNSIIGRENGYYREPERIQSNKNIFGSFNCDSNIECSSATAYDSHSPFKVSTEIKSGRDEQFGRTKGRKNNEKGTLADFHLPQDTMRKTKGGEYGRNFYLSSGIPVPEKPFDEKQKYLYSNNDFNAFDDSSRNSHSDFQVDKRRKNPTASNGKFHGPTETEISNKRHKNGPVDQWNRKPEKVQEFKSNNRESNPTFGKTAQSSKNVVRNVQCGLDNPRRIIGGTNTDIDEFPWLVLLQYWDGKNISHDCGGVLISKRYVLTAAHCTNGSSITSKNMQLRKVRLGEWDLSTDRDCQGKVCSSQFQDISVEAVIPHEGYGPKEKSQVHDIALIKLEKEANLNQYVQPICLPFEDVGNENYENKKLTVSGWGRTSNARDSASNVKKKVDLPVVNWNECSQFYQSYFGGLKIFKSQFCAGGVSGQDSCQGDSGGPLMTTEKKGNEMHWYVIGIVSSGPAACGVENRPSLYTNVSQYMNWILKYVKEI